MIHAKTRTRLPHPMLVGAVRRQLPRTARRSPLVTLVMWLGWAAVGAGLSSGAGAQQPNEQGPAERKPASVAGAAEGRGDAAAAGARAGEPSPVVRLIEATVKLVHPKSTATGILMRVPAEPGSPKDKDAVYLVTAAHVLQAADGNTLVLLLHPRGENGQYQKYAQELAIRRDGQPLWKQHESADVAVIRADLPEKLNLSTVPIDWLADDDAVRARHLDPGDLIRFIGFPHRIEGNGMGFPLVRLGCLATHPLLPLVDNRTILFDGNTFEGDSGGPAYVAARETPRDTSGSAGASDPVSIGHDPPGRRDTPLILGLVVGQHFLDEEVKTIYGQTKTRHRLGLGIIAPSPFIRQLLE